MAVELTATSKNFTGTGASSVYAPGFYINDSSQIVVTVDDVVQTIGDDYVVNNVGDSAGCNIVATFPLGSAVYIKRDTAITQEVDTQNNETILEDVIDASLDKLTMIAQEIDSKAERAIKVPEGEDGFTLSDASLRAGKYLGFDAQGDLVETSGTGTDPALRTDLAAVGWPGNGKGAGLLGPFAIFAGAQSITLYDRFERKMDTFDLGALSDNATNFIPALGAQLTKLVLAGGGICRLPKGNFAWLTDLPTITLAAEENIKIIGEGRDQTYLRLGGAATKGFVFRSTTTTPNRLPRFDFEGFTMAASGERLSWAIDAEWAINGDIEDPFNLDDVAIQQNIRSLADDGSDYGYFERLVRISNARNSNLKNFRFFGDMDRTALEQTEVAIQLDGECTSFRIHDGYILEAQKGILSTGATEGIYANNVDIVATQIGVDFGGGSVLEPQLTWQGGTIAALTCGLDIQNCRYFRVADTFILGKGGWNAQNPSTNWTGVKVRGALSGWGTIDAEFSKEDGQGSGGAISAAVEVLSPSAGVEVRGSVHAYSGSDPIDYGVILYSGVTRSKVDIQTLNVTVDVSFVRADGNTIIRRNPKEMQITGGDNQFLTVIGSLAAYLKMYDEGGGTDLKEGRLLWDGGTFTLMLVNDDGTTKKLPIQVGADGTTTIGDGAWNGMPLKLGSKYLWVDSSNRLRIKASVPTSDTDGTIVGTQL